MPQGNVFQRKLGQSILIETSDGPVRVTFLHGVRMAVTLQVEYPDNVTVRKAEQPQLPVETG